MPDYNSHLMQGETEAWRLAQKNSRDPSNLGLAFVLLCPELSPLAYILFHGLFLAETYSQHMGKPYPKPTGLQN